MQNPAKMKRSSNTVKYNVLRQNTIFIAHGLTIQFCSIIMQLLKVIDIWYVRKVWISY